MRSSCFRAEVILAEVKQRSVQVLMMAVAAPAKQILSEFA